MSMDWVDSTGSEWVDHQRPDFINDVLVEPSAISGSLSPQEPALSIFAGWLQESPLTFVAETQDVGLRVDYGVTLEAIAMAGATRPAVGELFIPVPIVNPLSGSFYIKTPDIVISSIIRPSALGLYATLDELGALGIVTNLSLDPLTGGFALNEGQPTVDFAVSLGALGSMFTLPQPGRAITSALSVQPLGLSGTIHAPALSAGATIIVEPLLVSSVIKPNDFVLSQAIALSRLPMAASIKSVGLSISPFVALSRLQFGTSLKGAGIALGSTVLAPAITITGQVLEGLFVGASLREVILLESMLARTVDLESMTSLEKHQ